MNYKESIIVQPDISLATAKNWYRLDVDISSKLTTRANKQMSKKAILPMEYLSYERNIDAINTIVYQISEKNIKVFDAIYSIAINLLKNANIYYLSHVQKVLQEYIANMNDYLLNLHLPSNERDILGLIYQCILFEGQKNITGSYYTPQKIVENMTSSVFLENQEFFLDPCCGSGSFLLALKAKPCQLFGIDNDPIAVFICKINLLLKFRDEVFSPQIYYLNFLQENSFANTPLDNLKFDYIVTNPPWGAKYKNIVSKEISSKETFSYFFVKSFRLLKKNGFVRFLFPKSVLNVKVHKDIRSFMLAHGNIESITLYDEMFSSVTTHFVDIELSNRQQCDFVNIYTPKKLFCVDKKSFYATDNLVFNFHRDVDSQIISQVKNVGKYTLKNSIWALGIVTGDNKNKLLNKPTLTSEPIYTGKEIMPYYLKPPLNHIEYLRNNFQQVAKEEYYRATEKLVYKFISNKLVFAYDNSQSLFLNSANILIPKIPNMSIKTVMAFLNSEVFQYLYSVLFSEIKILKGNLVELPFPIITKKQDLLLSEYVEQILNGNAKYIEILHNEIYDIFHIRENQKKHIREKLHGTFNQ